MAEAFDPYHAWLGIAPKDQPPTHYRLLGLDLFEDAAEVIEHAADQRMAHLRTFQAGKHGALSQRLLNEVAAAKICLLNRAKRAAYDAELRARLEASEDSFGRQMAAVLADVQPARRASAKTSRSSASFVIGGGALVVLVGVLAAWWAFSGKKAEPTRSAVAATVENPKPAAASQVSPPPPPIDTPKTVETPTQKPPAPVVVAEPKPVKLPEPQVAAAPAVEPPTPDLQTPTPTPQTPAPSPQPLGPSKLPVPEGPRVDEALKVAREAYQEEYTQAQTAVARGLLAKKILQKGVDTKDDPVARFVLLRLARDVAWKAEDPRLTFEAIDRLGEGFDLDPWAMKGELVSAAAKPARRQAEHKAAADQALTVMRGALEADACATAQEMAKLALSEAGKARDRELVAQARAGQKQAQQAAKSQEQVDAARAVLKATPDDPAANLAVGRYECLMKGDWAKGLEHLARCGDKTLATLAADDLAAPKADAARLKLADGWWDSAQKADGRERDALLLRAGYWYQQLGAIDDALVQTKVENRMAQIAKLGHTLGGPAPKQLATNSIGMRFVLVPAGDFLMGATPEENAWAMQAGKQGDEPAWYFARLPCEMPRHPVRISRPFLLAIYEVTQGEFEQIMGTNPSTFCKSGKRANRVAGQDTSRLPVDSVSWDDAAEFCRRLSALPKEQAARRTYRLPTEAEWEYACRAGSTSRWYCGDDEATLEQWAWFRKNSNIVPHPVGEKKPNAFGLYDMHGNMREWCLDHFGFDYYRQSPGIDPPGPPSGNPVCRGGAFSHTASYLRPAFRHTESTSHRALDQGFRVVLMR